MQPECNSRLRKSLKPLPKFERFYDEQLRRRPMHVATQCLMDMCRYPSVREKCSLTQLTHAPRSYWSLPGSWEHLCWLTQITNPHRRHRMSRVIPSTPELGRFEYEVLNMDYCHDSQCTAVSHIRIIDPKRTIILEPRMHCCRNLVADIIHMGHTPHNPAVKEQVVTWNCVPITATTLISSCFLQRDTRLVKRNWASGIHVDTLDPMKMASQVMMAGVIACAGWLIGDLNVDQDTKSTLSRYTLEQFAISCVWTLWKHFCNHGPPNTFVALTYSENDVPFSGYSLTATAWAAYEIGRNNSTLRNLLRNPFNSYGEFDLVGLVALLSRDNLVSDISLFKTDDSDIAFELISTFAAKMFKAHYPLSMCAVDLPRVWDMANNRLAPYKADTAVVGFISHVWLSNEIKYDDCKDGYVPIGNEKLDQLKFELQPICQYWWIDTLCINKSDMVELDMSIRSMHDWYSAASMVAVPSHQDLNVWLSRGWCLQEGQAAKALLMNTSCLARGGDDMLSILLEIGCVKAGMPASLWLSLMQVRETSRVEDKAYSLIGLLKLDFQIMYGERGRAWTRLIEQIAVQNGDLSWMKSDTRDLHLIYAPKNYIPRYINSDYISWQISDRPIRISHIGMEVYVTSADRDTKKKWIKQLDSLPYLQQMELTPISQQLEVKIVSGTAIVIIVWRYEEHAGYVISAMVVSGIKSKGVRESLWIR